MLQIAAAALAALLIVALSILAWARWSMRDYPEESEKTAGTYASHFICVNDDGTVRELTPEETAYLNTVFHPADSNRPYIKKRHGERTPDGRLSGFLLRRRLPRRLR